MAQKSQGSLLPVVGLWIGLRKDAQSSKLGFTADIYTLWAGKCLCTFSERGAWKSGIFRSKGICNWCVDFLPSSFWARITISLNHLLFPFKASLSGCHSWLHPGAEQLTAILGPWQLLSPLAPWAERTEEFPKMAPTLDPFSSRTFMTGQTAPNKDTKKYFC